MIIFNDFLILIIYLLVAGDIGIGVSANYKLLWVLLLSTLSGFFFQIYAMQLSLASGKDLANLGRIHLKKRTSVFLWLMAEIAIIGSDV